MAAEKDGVVKKGRGFQSKGSLASLHNNGRLSMQTPSSQWSTGVQKGEEDRVVKVKKEESSTVTKGVQRARGLTMNPRVLRINAPNGLDGIKAQDEDRDERIGALKPESVAPKEGQPTAATAAVQGVMWAYSLAPIAGRGHVRSKASDFWEDESQDFAHENPTKPRTPEKVNTPKTKRKRTPGSAGKSVLVDCYGSSPQPRWPLKKPPGIPNDHKWRGSQPSKPRPLSVPPLPRGRPLSPFITALRRYSAGPTGPMSIPPLIRHGRAPNVREIIPQGSLLTTEKHPGVMAGSHLNTLVGRLGTGIDTGTTATEPKAEVGQSRTGPPNMANPLETTGHPFRRPMNPPALPHSRVPVVRKILVPHAGFPTSQPSIPVAPSYGSSFPPSPPVLNMNESHPSFPPVTPKIPIKSEGLESPRPTKMTHRRSYTRGQEPRGQGDWDEGGGRGRDWREDLNNDHRRPTINRVLHTPRGPPLGPRFADSRYHGSSPLDISIRLATPRQAALEALSRDPLVRCGINRCRNWASRLAAPESISTARPMTLEDLARLYQAPQNSAVPPNSAVSQGTNASQASTTGNKTGGNSAAPQGANTRQASNKTDANSAVAQRTSTLQARTTIKQTDGNSAVPQGKTTLQATTTTKKSSENYAMPQGTEAIQAIMSPRSRVDPQLRPVVRLPTTGSLSDAALASRSGLTNAPIPPPVNYPMGPMTIRRGMSQENFETLASPQAPGPNGQQMQARNAMVVGFNVNVDEENENGGVNSQAPGWVPGPNQWSPGMPLRHQQQYWAPVMSQYGNEQGKYTHSPSTYLTYLLYVDVESAD